MADNKQQVKKETTPGAIAPKKAAAIRAEGCLAEGCKLGPARAGFCDEHYSWFKEGLVTKDGRRPLDFEKKFFHYQNRRSKSA